MIEQFQKFVKENTEICGLLSFLLFGAFIAYLCHIESMKQKEIMLELAKQGKIYLSK